MLWLEAKTSCVLTTRSNDDAHRVTSELELTSLIFEAANVFIANLSYTKRADGSASRPLSNCATSAGPLWRRVAGRSIFIFCRRPKSTDWPGRISEFSLTPSIDGGLFEVHLIGTPGLPVGGNSSGRYSVISMGVPHCGPLSAVRIAAGLSSAKRQAGTRSVAG